MIGEENPKEPQIGKIVVIIDIPEEVKRENGITEEELNQIVTDSVFMIVKMVDELLSKKKGLKDKPKSEPDDYVS